MKVTLIIPVYNEEASIGPVVESALEQPGLDSVIVVDNGSTDNTPTIAALSGAKVVSEPHRGYGSACLAGIASAEDAEILVFADGDGADRLEELSLLLDPIKQGAADLVIGSRLPHMAEPGAFTWPQLIGNWLATRLISICWGHRYFDLGPFRAIRQTSLAALNMQDRNFGWTIEMQIKAIVAGLRVREIPVSYRRRRSGKSKISGTFSGVVRAGTKIIWIIFSLRFLRSLGVCPINERETRRAMNG